MLLLECVADIPSSWRCPGLVKLIQDRECARSVLSEVVMEVYWLVLPSKESTRSNHTALKFH